MVCAALAAWILWESIFSQVSLWTIATRFMLVFILAAADQFFRFFFRKLKRIWLVETGFIVFTILVVWVIGNW